MMDFLGKVGYLRVNDCPAGDRNRNKASVKIRRNQCATKPVISKVPNEGEKSYQKSFLTNILNFSRSTKNL